MKSWGLTNHHHLMSYIDTLLYLFLFFIVIEKFWLKILGKLLIQDGLMWCGVYLWCNTFNEQKWGTYEMGNVWNGCLPQFYFFGEADVWSLFGNIWLPTPIFGFCWFRSMWLLCDGRMVVVLSHSGLQVCVWFWPSNADKFTCSEQKTLLVC